MSAQAASTEQAMTPGFGLFHVVYTNQVIPGGVGISLNLVVSTPQRHITGVLDLTQAVNPFFRLSSRVSGSYTDIPLRPPHHVAKLTGYPVIHWPPHGGIGPVILPNADVTFSASDNWKEATADINYLGNDGQWKHLTDVKLKASS